MISTLFPLHVAFSKIKANAAVVARVRSITEEVVGKVRWFLFLFCASIDSVSLGAAFTDFSLSLLLQAVRDLKKEGRAQKVKSTFCRGFIWCPHHDLIVCFVLSKYFVGPT